MRKNDQVSEISMSVASLNTVPVGLELIKVRPAMGDFHDAKETIEKREILAT